MMVKIWMTLFTKLNIALICSWDYLKLIKLTLKQMFIHILSSLNIMFGLEERKNGQNGKNEYPLVGFLLYILTLGRDAT